MKLSQIIVQILNDKRHFAFLSPTLEGITYTVPLSLIGKLVMDYLLVIELFSLGVTPEALLANVDWKSEFFANGASLAHNFR